MTSTPNGDPAAYFASLAFDRRLAEYDVRGSVAWARALNAAGVLSTDEVEQVIKEADRNKQTGERHEVEPPLNRESSLEGQPGDEKYCRTAEVEPEKQRKATTTWRRSRMDSAPPRLVYHAKSHGQHFHDRRQ